MNSRKRTLGELIFEGSDCEDDEFRHYSQRCSGNENDEDEEVSSETSQLFLNNPLPFENDEIEDEEVLSETSQLFFNNPLPFYYQVGSGFEDQPGPSSRGQALVEGYDPENLENAVIVEERRRRTNRRYNAEEVTFHARIDSEEIPPRLRITPLVAAVHAVRQLVTLLILQCTRNLRPTDLIRFCFDAIGLDRPVSTTLMLVAALTVESVVAPIMRVLQSYKHLKLEHGVTVDVIIIHRDVGAGRSRKVINLQTDTLTKRSILQIKPDNIGLCCAKAILFALAHLDNDKSAISILKDKRRDTLMKRAKKLHNDAGVPLGPCTYKEIKMFEDWLNIQIVVISSNALNKVTYRGENRSRRITLYLHNNHYDVIKSLKGFYGTDHYCESCDKPYGRIEDHRCPNACHVCLRVDCIPGDMKRCSECDRLCQSEDCYLSHKSKSGRQQFSLCDKMYQCRKCSKVILRRYCPKELHQCGTTKCPSCKYYVVAADHFCFLKTVPPKPHSDRLIFFDFETDQSSGVHEVNFAVAQNFKGEEFVFKGYTSCSDFCSWLFSPVHKNFTAIAHNMKGFDGQFIMAWMLQQGVAPHVIPNGTKLMAFSHTSLNIKVIDSYNFLPMALSKLPGCFGLTELKKGFFPHLFNTKENQHYVGPFPEAKYYSPEQMSSKVRDEFLKWHDAQKGKTFDFQAEILAYCRSDVDILKRTCLEFRVQLIEIANVDPFCYVTIASLCMAIFRSLHLVEDTIAMIPIYGYVNKTKFSHDAIRWLDYIAFKENIVIKHGMSKTGEHKINGIPVDGYCAETKTIYQYHGCFFHGCPECFDGDTLNPLLGLTMKTLFEKTKVLATKLQETGHILIQKWEHEFHREIEEDIELQNFVKSHELKNRLNPRDAFFGGRTNAIKLFYEGKAKYVDFTSLYPWVNKYCKYPLGHPTIITEDFGSIEDYFGLILCKVLPPRGLLLPVLPVRCNGKLMFPLCLTCAETLSQSPCTHSDEKRAFTGTWVTEEIKLAIQKGYQVTKVYEVYHFPSTSSNLFKAYIDMFLKIKQESSGYPAGCTTNEQKQEYIRNYKDKEGIQLDEEKICKNPGRRQVAKLALNSFWGRWGMNLNKTQLTYVHSLPQFNKLLADPAKDIKDVYLPTEDVAAIVWENKKQFVPQDTTTNVFLAAFTTAWARLKLYSEMDKLGDAVLYHDTDSIIYASNGTNDPPLGNFLGEFTDELNGDTITTFVSAGPKNYAYRTSSGETCCKVRGFTLNFKNSQELNFNSIRHLVCNMDQSAGIIIKNKAKITRDGKRRKVYNKEESKLYRMVYDKRVVKDDLSTVPYGY